MSGMEHCYTGRNKLEWIIFTFGKSLKVIGPMVTLLLQQCTNSLDFAFQLTYNSQHAFVTTAWLNLLLTWCNICISHNCNPCSKTFNRNAVRWLQLTPVLLIDCLGVIRSQCRSKWCYTISLVGCRLARTKRYNSFCNSGMGAMTVYVYAHYAVHRCNVYYTTCCRSVITLLTQRHQCNGRLLQH